MRLLWATPFNVKSAIGTFSREVCQELKRRGVDIQIIRIESGPEAKLPSISSDIEVLPPDALVPDGIDLTVINYGNHAPYHAGALRLAATAPSLAIFHDAEMRHFASGIFDRHEVSLPLLPGKMLQSETLDMVPPEARPPLQSLSAMACGAVVHGPHYFPTVAETCPGPVAVIPLCFPDICASDLGLRRSGPPRVTMFGVINKYKQPDRLIHAVALLKMDCGDIEINFVGAVEDGYRTALLEMARDLSIVAPKFHGEVSDHALSELLTQSDVICCLRYPVTEGGSASLITALYHGRPLIVSNVASYAIVPDSLISKISYDEDAISLSQALRTLIAEPDVANDRAMAARTWARENFSADTYVDRLQALIEQAVTMLPSLRATRQLASTICFPNNGLMLPVLTDLAIVAESFLFPRKRVLKE